MLPRNVGTPLCVVVYNEVCHSEHSEESHDFTCPFNQKMASSRFLAMTDCYGVLLFIAACQSTGKNLFLYKLSITHYKDSSVVPPSE